MRAAEVETAGAGFPRSWSVEVLRSAPLIAPARSYTYPQQVPGEEEAIARGALDLMVRPAAGGAFLATCALGFLSESVPTGVWGCPRAEDLCAVAGGYGYVIDTTQPERSTMLPMRPVVEVKPLVEAGLLLFAGFHAVLAWDKNGIVWETARLSWEGIRLGEVAAGRLHGWGWEMRSDRELPFTVDLATGRHEGGGYVL